MGYGEVDLDALTEQAWPQKRVIDNAPRPITKDELRTMLAGAMAYS